MIAFYNGASGMIAYQESLNVVSHNVANVNTVGFKSARSSFNDLLYTRMNTKVEGENLTGHGIKHQDTDLIFHQSPLQQTMNPLDFAIADDYGLFALRSPDGQVSYTRNGAFAIGMNGNTMYLVSADDGSYVLDSRGANIQIPVQPNTGNVPNLEGLAQKIGVYTFSNPYGLESQAGSRFTPSEISGAAIAMSNSAGVIREGMLEASGSDLTQEMTRMIEAQRAFQMSAKVIQTADELENVVNNLR